MLNARKHMHDKDTQGDVSSGYGMIKKKNIYVRLCLVRIETFSRYKAHKIVVESRHKAQYDK